MPSRLSARRISMRATPCDGVIASILPPSGTLFDQRLQEESRGGKTAETGSDFSVTRTHRFFCGPDGRPHFPRQSAGHSGRLSNSPARCDPAHPAHLTAADSDYVTEFQNVPVIWKRCAVRKESFHILFCGKHKYPIIFSRIARETLSNLF
jgi:hypothetical protein